MEKPLLACAAAAYSSNSNNNSHAGATRFLLHSRTRLHLSPCEDHRPSQEGHRSSTTEVAVTPKFRVLEAQQNPQPRRTGPARNEADAVAMNGLAATSSSLLPVPLGQKKEQGKEQGRGRRPPTFPAELLGLPMTHPASPRCCGTKSSVAAADWIEPAVLLFSRRVAGTGPNQPRGLDTPGTQRCCHEADNEAACGSSTEVPSTAAPPHPVELPAAAAPVVVVVVAHLGDVDEAAHRHRQQHEQQRRSRDGTTAAAAPTVLSKSEEGSAGLPYAPTNAAVALPPPPTSFGVERGWDVTDRAAEGRAAVRAARNGRFAVWSSRADAGAPVVVTRDGSKAGPAARGDHSLCPTALFPAATPDKQVEEGAADAVRRVDPLATLLFAIPNNDDLGNDITSDGDAPGPVVVIPKAASGGAEDDNVPQQTGTEVPTVCVDPEDVTEVRPVEHFDARSEAIREIDVADAVPTLPGTDRASPPWRYSLGYDIIPDLNSTGAAVPSAATQRFAVLDGTGKCTSPTTATNIRNGDEDRPRCRANLREFAARASLLLAKQPRSDAELDHAIEPLLPVLLTMVGASKTTTPVPRPEATDRSHGEAVEALPTAIEPGSSILPPPETNVDGTASPDEDSVPILINTVDPPAPCVKETKAVLQRPKEEENDVNATSLPAGPDLTRAAERRVNPAEAAHLSIPCNAPPVTMFSMISERDNVARQVPSKLDAAVTHVPTAQFAVWGTGDERNSARGGDRALSRRREHSPNRRNLPAPLGSVVPPPLDPRIEQSYVSILLRHPLNVVKPEQLTDDAEAGKGLDVPGSASIAEEISATVEIAAAQRAVSDGAEDPSIASQENVSAIRPTVLGTTVTGVGEVVMTVEPAGTPIPLNEDTAVTPSSSNELRPFSAVRYGVATPIKPLLDPVPSEVASAGSSTQANIESPLPEKSSDNAMANPAHVLQSEDSPSALSSTSELGEVPRGPETPIEPSYDSVVTADDETQFSTSAVATDGKGADTELIVDCNNDEDPSMHPRSSLDSQPFSVVTNDLSLPIESTQDLPAVTADVECSSYSDSKVSSSLVKENTNSAPSRAVLGGNMSISTAGELSKNINVPTLPPNVQTNPNNSEKSSTPESAPKQPSAHTEGDTDTSKHLHSTPDPSKEFATNESSDDLKVVSSRDFGALPGCEIQAQYEAPARSVGPTLAEIVARHTVDSNTVVESTVSKGDSTSVLPPKLHSQGTVRSSVSKGPVNWKSIPLTQSATGGAGRDKRRDHRSSKRQNLSAGGAGWKTVDRINGRSRSSDAKVDSIDANGALTLAQEDVTASEHGESQPSTKAAQGEQAGAETPSPSQGTPSPSQGAPSPSQGAPTAPNISTSDAPGDPASASTSVSTTVATNVSLESEKKSDITVYGATSFVAQHVLTYLQRASLALARPLRITLGGRDAAKLDSLKEKCERKMEFLSTMYSEPTGMCSFNVIVAESADTVALNEMVKQTSVVLSCAGPFCKYSSNVVGACARAGVDYVDITGEVRWAGTMRERYGSEAAKSGSRIVSFCGFDSIPSDIAVFAAVSALRKACKKKSVDVVSATTWHSSVGGVNGGTVHTALDAPFEPRQFLQHPVPFFIEDPLSLVLPRLKTDPAMQMARNRFAKAEWLNLLPRAESIFALGVSIPFFMAAINAKVVQASALALNYGPNFKYYERMVPVGYKLTTKLRLVSVVPALMVPIACSIGLLILKLPLVGFKLAMWLFPPGSGSSDQFCAAGHAEVYAEVSTAQNKAGLCDKANSILKFQGDPANYATAQCVCEAALALVFNRTELPPRSEDGFGTPAELLGFALIRRLKESPVRPVVLETHVRLNASQDWQMYLD